MEPLRTVRGCRSHIYHGACALPSTCSNPAFTLHPKALGLVGQVLLSEAGGSPVAPSVFISETSLSPGPSYSSDFLPCPAP